MTTMSQGIKRSCLMTVIAAASLLPASASQSRVRALAWDPTISISSRLRDDDEVVVVNIVGGDEIAFDTKVTAKDKALWGASVSDVVVVATLEDSHPVLVRRGTWIHTSFQGVVQQVLKARDTVRVSPGKTIEGQIQQGEMQIGKVLVRAGPPLPAIKTGRQYLLFLKTDPELGALLQTMAPLIVDVDGNTLDAMDGDLRDKGELAGLTLRDIVSIVKKAR
jgi:hypothetical protein